MTRRQAPAFLRHRVASLVLSAAALCPALAHAQQAVDQQNPASAFNCLNVGSFTMSQTFVPTFDRLNFAEIHLTGNSGPAVNGDFSLQLLRNGSLVRESDRLNLATAGFTSGYYRFNFSNQAFLNAGQQYELKLVNHSATSFFRWCQSELNSYTAGAPIVSPSGGGSGDFLFRTGMQSIFGPPQAVAQGDGYTLFETALSPPAPLGSGGSTSVSSGFYSGVNFEVAEPTRLSKVGGYFTGGSGSIFAAVFQASGFGTVPTPPNLTGADVLGTTLISLPPGAGNASGDLDLVLQPGWYGLVFGTGRFGATASSTGLRDTGKANGFWSPYSIRQSDGMRFFQASKTRIFAQATPASGVVQERPVFDTEAEQFGGQWILTDGGTSIAPDRFDFFNTDARGLLEFQLGEIPVGANVTSAKIRLDFNQLTSGGGDGPRIFFHGYAGDGVATAADASSPLNQIGASDIITEFEPLEVALDAAYIQSLVDQGTTHLGLMLRGENNGHRAHFLTWEEGDAISVPLLTIEFEQPGDFNGDTFVNGDDYQEWTGRFGADLDGQDFLAWQRGFDGSSSAAAVPEPGTIGLAVAFALLGAAMPTKATRRARVRASAESPARRRIAAG